MRETQRKKKKMCADTSDSVETQTLVTSMAYDVIFESQSERRLQKRLRAIAHVKRLPSYALLLQHLRRRDVDSRTYNFLVNGPNPHENRSKRSFDGLIQRWKSKLLCYRHYIERYTISTIAAEWGIQATEHNTACIDDGSTGA